ncbi:hypothetical protein R6V09_18445 [Streptomyces sp. W16]|uniref:hypothetical protein n=1 Tax=Streptomyces sp. W16 TaxID=3076631 RepID=UPI00295B44E0|nr:hypothetical protein [Streptomyces sp. W16]MDV9172081.1 hypothetical protein [Streptomyces sp. W16]
MPASSAFAGRYWDQGLQRDQTDMDNKHKQVGIVVGDADDPREGVRDRPPCPDRPTTSLLPGTTGAPTRSPRRDGERRSMAWFRGGSRCPGGDGRLED